MMDRANIKVIEREMLTPRDVSIAYGIAEGTLANWRHQKIGPRFYRLGGRKIAYDRRDLDQWATREPVLTRDCAGARL